jgi:hypothetical protein
MAVMRALFADISETERQRRQAAYASTRDERRRVLALCDAVQIAVAQGQQDRVDMLLEQMHAIVDAALARRRLSVERISP